jgi:hypothetical protein
MTRKDYRLIAQALRDAADDHNRAGRYEAYHGILDAALVLSKRLQYTNPRFHRQKFLIACGYNPSSQAVLELAA